MFGSTRNTKWLVRSLVIGGAVGALALSADLGRAEDGKPQAGAARVQRAAPESAADVAVRTRLQGPAAKELGRNVTLGALASAYETALGVSVKITDAAREEAGAQEVPLPTASGLTAAQQLDFALWQLDLHVAVRDGGLTVGTTSEVVGVVDRRVYDIRPVQAALAEHWNASQDDGAEPHRRAPALGAEDMIMLIQGAVGPYQVWMGKEVSASTVDGGIAVVQTAEVHAKIEDFLGQLATYHRPREKSATPAELRLATGLARNVSVRAAEMPLGDVALRLEEAMGAPVLAAADCAETPVSLDLIDIPAEQAATWCARTAGVHLSVQDGVLLFSDEPPTDTRLYDVGSAITPSSARVLLDHVMELAITLEPQTWEEIGSAEGLSPDMLLVRNTPSVHAKIERLLDALGKLGDTSTATSPVPVVIESPESTADRAVRARLAKAATAPIGDFALALLPLAIRDAYGINVVIGKPGTAPKDVTISVAAADGLTVRQQLSRALRPAGLDIGVQDGVLRIGPAYAPVGATERRYFDLRPIVEAFAARARAASPESSAAGEPGSHRASLGEEDIVSLVQNCVGPTDTWTSAGVSLAAGRELLVSVHTRDVHERTHHMLERLLDYEGRQDGVRADPAGSVWFYDVGDVLDPAGAALSEEDLLARVRAIEPATWESDAWVEMVAPDLLVVNNAQEIQTQIPELLARLSEK